MRAWPCLSTLLLVSALPIQAQVYRWVDAGGVVHYSDKPHRQNAKPVALPPLQTMASGDVSDPFAGNASKPAPEASAMPAPSIISPAQDATIRDAQDQVTVTVDATLKPGQGLVYSVDGRARNRTPTPSTAYRLDDVYRGTHQLAVALVGADGRTLARSRPVTIYMKPPTVHHPRR